MTTNRNVLSLFSGAGGDTLGFERAGFTVTHFSEFNEPAIQTHLAAFPNAKLLKAANDSTNIKDIADSQFEELRGRINLIFAGFPCQGFSHGGKKRMNDPRNELVHEFVRATRLIQPEWIVGENVKGLLSRKGIYPANTTPRPVIEIIRDLFAAIGYKITYRLFDATEVGVPQLRKRLIIVGHKGSLYPHIPWANLPPLVAPPTIRKLLESTLEGAVELPQLYKPAEKPPHFWIRTLKKEPTGTPHPNLVRLVAGIRNLSSAEKKAQGKGEKERIPITEAAGLISFGTRASGYHGQVLNPDAASKTIICAYNQCPRLFVGLHNTVTKKFYVRCLTVKECGQIQGFPADYPWKGSPKDAINQIGNAVPPPLATTVAQLLEKATFHETPQEVILKGAAAAAGADDDSEEEDED